MLGPPAGGRLCWLLAVIVLPGWAAVAEANPQSLEGYLAAWQLAAADREVLIELLPGRTPAAAAPPAALNLLIRLLDRLQAAPQDWQQAWREQALPAPAVDLAECLEQSRPVRLSGRAVETRQVGLPDELAEIAGRSALSLVRLQQDAGPDVWLVVPQQPTGWPAAGRLNERAASEALLITGPAAVGPGGVDLLAVSLRLSWWPDTPLADAGMDYGLFTSVVDGRPLAAAEAEAFYNCLEASKQLAPTAEMRPLPAADLVPLIDPRAGWFAAHRGDRLVLEGTARRITRIAVTSERWQKLIGQDHYWELFLFVSTPLIKIAGKMQESYPVVCCCLDLPPGLPTGDQVTERLRLAGFGFKRYRYETRQQQGPAAALVRESPLLLAGRPLWLPAAAAAQLPVWLRWLPVALAVAAAFLLWQRSWRRRPPAAALPDRIELPLTATADPLHGKAEKTKIGTGPPVDP